MKFKNDTFKNILTLLSGTVLAQALPILIAPLISRIYDEHDFAVYADFISIFALVSVIANGRYNLAIIVAKNTREAVNLLALAVICAVFVSILSLIAIALFADQISAGLENTDLKKFLFFLPAAVLFFGLYEAINYWLSRKKMYKTLVSTKISRSVGSSSMNFGFWFIELKSWGLIISQIIGDAIAAVWAILVFKKLDSKKIKLIRISRIKRAAIKYKDYPLFNTLQAFSDKVRESGTIIIMSVFFSELISGNYFFGFKYARAPLALISYSVFQVYFQKFSEIVNQNKRLYPVFMSAIKRNLLMAVGIFLVFFFLSEPLFSFVFGDKWLSAGTYVKLLAPMLAISFISGNISFTPLILNKQRQFMFVSLIYNLGVPTSMYIVATQTKDAYLTVMAQTVTSSLALIIIIVWMYLIVKQNDKHQ